MEKTYYTPLLEDFHVGFEYEAYIPEKEKWSEEIFHLNQSHINLVEYVGIQNENTLRKIRVKQLGKECIESLGLICEVVECGDDTEHDQLGIRQKDESAYFGTFYMEISPDIDTNIELCNLYFKVKNISEFKKLLTQLSIPYVAPKSQR